MAKTHLVLLYEATQIEIGCELVVVQQVVGHRTGAIPLKDPLGDGRPLVGAPVRRHHWVSHEVLRNWTAELRRPPTAIQLVLRQLLPQRVLQRHDRPQDLVPVSQRLCIG